jgi:hypothetical protein
VGQFFLPFTMDNRISENSGPSLETSLREQTSGARVAFRRPVTITYIAEDAVDHRGALGHLGIGTGRADIGAERAATPADAPAVGATR